MSVNSENIVENLPVEGPKIVEKSNQKSIPRQRNTYYCRNCNINFNSIANTRAKCPTCARACSIKITSENAEKYNSIQDPNDSSEKIVFEPSFIQKSEPISIIQPNLTLIQETPRKILQLKTEDFKDMVELFNAGASQRGIPIIKPEEINNLFDTVNNYFKENKIFEGAGKTGVVDIVMKVTGMIIDRLIPVLVTYFKDKKGEVKLENGEILKQKNDIDYEKISDIVVQKLSPILQKQIGDILEKKT
jgi:hypothetical protein